MSSPVPQLEIRTDALDGPEVAALLGRHMALMVEVTPPGHVHALPIDGLRRAHVTAWTAWRRGALVGCGALRELDPRHGEIKAMHTAEAVRGQGVGRAILRHIVREARRRGYRRLSLETGSMDAFAPARALYARHGFTLCGAFGDYLDDPNSVFMTLVLGEQDTGAVPLVR